MRPKIGDFEFGEVYGENEVLFLDNYSKYFYDINNSLSKLDRKNKMLVIGRKGTGRHCLLMSTVTPSEKIIILQLWNH